MLHFCIVTFAVLLAGAACSCGIIQVIGNRINKVFWRGTLMSRKLTPFAAGLLASSFMIAPAFAQDAGADEGAEAFDDNVIIVTATRRA